MYLLIDNFVLNAGAQPLRQKLNFSRVKEEGGQRRVGGRTRLLSNWVNIISRSKGNQADYGRGEERVFQPGVNFF